MGACRSEVRPDVMLKEVLAEDEERGFTEVTM